MLRYLTAGESHGKSLVAIIEGIPSNMVIDIEKINDFLFRRQSGYGRGERMKIENDYVEILSGVRDGKTIGSPICLKINNRDWDNWKEIMGTEKVVNPEKIAIPRPGHADLTGSIKYDHDDIRNTIERASARETAIRTAVGCIAQQFLENFGVQLFSHVIQIGNVKIKNRIDCDTEFNLILDKSLLRCVDLEAELQMMELINQVKENGDTLGGVFEIAVLGVPIGIGSCMHYDRKLDARIAFGLMSIQGIKGIEFGLGFEYAERLGSKTHDGIFWNGNDYYRKTNNAGGIEGGMSNGEPIIIRAAMKPIPTLNKPLKSVHIITKNEADAHIHRSDVCAVPAASIVGQSAVAWEIACAFIEKFGGDSIREIKRNYRSYLDNIK